MTPPPPRSASTHFASEAYFAQEARQMPAAAAADFRRRRHTGLARLLSFSGSPGHCFSGDFARSGAARRGNRPRPSCALTPRLIDSRAARPGCALAAILRASRQGAGHVDTASVFLLRRQFDDRNAILTARFRKPPVRSGRATI